MEVIVCRKKVTLRDLQSLIGLLSFACSVVLPGRAFLRRVIDLTCGVKNPHHYIRLTCEARADLYTWYSFIQHYNGKSILLPSRWLSSDYLTLFTDASGSVGFAAVLGKNWFASRWDNDLKHYQIAIKELFPIVLAIEIWGNTLSYKRILFMSDNMAVLDIINKQTSKEKTLMKLVRRLVISTLKYNIQFKSKHIPGKHNETADHLTRFKFQEAFKSAPHLSQHQTTIP